MKLKLSVRRDETSVTYTVYGVYYRRVLVEAVRLADREALEKILRHFIALSVDAQRAFRKANPGSDSASDVIPALAELEINVRRETVREDVIDRLSELQRSIESKSRPTLPGTEPTSEAEQSKPEQPEQ